MTLYDLAFGPFAEFGFMRRALVGCLALALGGGPIGTFLVIRRMSLMGDALSHAVLPGAALGFILGGLSLPAISLGGVGAGLVVALLSGLVTRLTPLREDASFAAFYLISLAIGVLLVSTHGSNVDLLHLLFGSILAIDDATLVLIGAVASIGLLSLAIIYRPLVVECFDPGFLRAVGGRGGLVHTVFLALVVLNLVAGFQALGTLMAVGLMMLPPRPPVSGCASCGRSAPRAAPWPLPRDFSDSCCHITSISPRGHRSSSSPASPISPRYFSVRATACGHCTCNAGSRQHETADFL